MLDGKGRILPILAAVLLAVALAVGLMILFIRIPADSRLEEHLMAAHFALEDGDGVMLRRELLKASRNAVSVDHWQQILRVAGEQVRQENRTDSFKLFTTLAGRAAAAIPGNEDFYGYWAWGLLRSGNIAKAEDQIESLPSAKWSSLRAEIRLKSLIGENPADIVEYIDGLDESPDPEFLSRAAMLTESAELTLDAALLYMREGRVDKAYEHALLLEDDARRWTDETTYSRRGAADAMAAIAQDAGRSDDAIRWLTDRVEDTQRRRVSSWETLQFLGDLLWDRYRLRGGSETLSRAKEAWSAAMGIVRDEYEGGSMPDGAWRLWLNLSVLEETTGSVRESNALLEEALALFPDREEVKAAWSIGHMDSDPALARRLVRGAYDQSSSPIMGVTMMIVDPESITPRLYEARLWDFFDAATSPDGRVHDTDARTIATFVLDYMSSRKNFSSVDVAVDRFVKAHPDESWILSWRLAADAARGMSLVDMVGKTPGATSPYEEFRETARSEKSWRALHDVALYSIMASQEMRRAAVRMSASGAGKAESETAEETFITVIANYSRLNNLIDTPMQDRVSLLMNNHGDELIRKLNSGGRRGIEARETAKATLISESGKLLDRALDDLTMALGDADSLEGPDLSSLYYLQALILNELGLRAEAVNKARQAVEADPENNRAREILTSEVSA